MAAHSERKHAKYSASSIDRLEACPGSAALSEGQPDTASVWAQEGTDAHEVLEAVVLRDRDLKRIPEELRRRPPEMFSYAERAAEFILDLAVREQGELLVENKCDEDLAFISPDAGGTLDYAIVAVFGTLHVIDYKYGAGHAVSPVENRQMITYAIAIAKRYNWNFKRVRMWIIQPRIKGYDGPVFWEIPIAELLAWKDRIQAIVDRAEAEPETYVEGGHCHWCKGKKVCPLKTQGRIDKAKQIFSPIGGDDGSESEESEIKSEAEWREEARRRKGHKAHGKKEGRETEAAKKARARAARGRVPGIIETDFF